MGLKFTLNLGSIFPKHLIDRIRLQAELLSYKLWNLSIILLTSKALVVYSVSVEGLVNGRVSQGRLVNAKSLTESLAEENLELVSSVSKGAKFRP